MTMNHSTKILIMLATLGAAACGPKTETYSSADGQTVAVGKGDQWTIKNAEGQELVTDYDSMVVVDRDTATGRPITFYYQKGREQHWYQYYTTLTRRSEGRMVDGKREGRWVFYHPNGMPQVEATYAGGVENGPYTVFRDNGVPYYRGQYAAGRRSGSWEVYDTEGNLTEKREY